jgi:Na+-transporting NADH:ubiquinone oxidoreductase subunit NqrF
MTAKAARLIVLAGLLAGSRPVDAHHAFSAEFDADKPVKLTGSVTKLDWTNPHAWIYLDVKDASGKVANWGFELASPNGLMRNGWTRFSLKPGDIVTVEGSRAKNGSTKANAQVVVSSSGQRLFAGAGDAPQP